MNSKTDKPTCSACGDFISGPISARTIRDLAAHHHMVFNIILANNRLYHQECYQRINLINQQKISGHRVA